MKKSRFLSLIAAAALAVTSLGTGMIASAAEGTDPEETTTHTVTIEKKDSEKHTFEAYQLFTGTLTNGAMTEIAWGSNVDTDKLLTVLKGEDTDKVATGAIITAFTPIADFMDGENLDATKVANAISNNSTLATAFADVFNAALKDAPNEPAGSTTIDKGTTNKTGTITGLDTGYYLIKDQNASLANTDGAYTDFILKLVEDVTVASKSEAPTISKVIVEDGADKDATTASIGDRIDYRLDSKVPDMQGYNAYYFIVGDKMCQGLTFEAVDRITIDGTDLEASAYEVKQTNLNDSNNTFEIVFKNFIQYASQKGNSIQIYYHATLNEGCDRTETGNPNEVGLTFSNNPNYKYDNTTDEPDDKSPMGETPKDSTIVFTTGIKIVKIDRITRKPLSGAVFKIVGNDGVMNQVVVSVAEVFEEATDSDAKYYQLKNGTYTQTAPTAATSAYYENTSKKYKKSEEKGTTTTEMMNGTSGITAEVDADGILTFSGLGAGTYTITEEVAPDYYNKLTDPIEITLSANPTQDETGTWNPNWNGQPTSGLYVVEQEIENSKDIILPATGGIGTVIFYVVGSLLIGAAVVLFVAKRKKGTAEK